MEKELLELLNNSYSPYSNFKVAAIVIMKDGTKFKGVNVENVSYGATICAERSAILNAISNGYKRYDFKELYVMCDSDIIGTPCFNCRMVISELFEKNCRIISLNNKGDREIHTVEELCPYPFSDKNIGR